MASKTSLTQCIALVLILFFSGNAYSDPALPPPKCPFNCALICFQMTHAYNVPGTDNWRFEFEVLNWTQYEDPSCSSNCISSIGCVTSPGSSATGLSLVRVANLSSANMQIVPTDPNGAPHRSVEVDVTGNLTMSNGELILPLGCDYRFTSEIVGITTNALPTGTCAAPADCVSLAGDIDNPYLLFSSEGLCNGVFTDGDDVTVTLKVEESWAPTCSIERNNWTPAQLSENQLIWRRPPGGYAIPPRNPILNPCPNTCADKDSGANVLDGFVIEIQDFQPGEQIVFNWYLLDDAGPIAAGSPPTATDPGSLQESPNDPLAFRLVRSKSIVSQIAPEDATP